MSGLSRGPRDVETAVACPGCELCTLQARFGCLETAFVCTGCGRRFALAELVRLVDDEAFARLASLVGGRLSDRI